MRSRICPPWLVASSPAWLGLILGFSAATLNAATALPRLEAVTPDGDLADWGDRGARLPFLTPDSTRLPDPARSGVSARFGWDDRGLLIAVEVTDTTPHEAHLASAGYTADSVELFLAVEPAKPGCIQLVLSPGKDPAHPAPRHYVFNNSSVESQPPGNEPAWAVKARADGYVAEVRLPWAALRLQAAAGLTIGTRLYVNDQDDQGVRTRFVWQPEARAERFHGFTLAADATTEALDAPVAWTALDVAESTGRLNLIARASLAGSSWQVRQGEQVLGEFRLTADGGAASGTVLLPAGRAAGTLTLIGPANAIMTVMDNSPGDATGVIGRASSGRISAADKALLAFARTEFPHHIFTEPRFPRLDFIDPVRVARFLGAAPTIVTRWMDAGGRDVTVPKTPGRYAARSELTIPGRAQPLVLEHLLYRMPAGTGLPPETDEVAARILGFGLQGGDATPSQSARVAERWWHGIRRARGWSDTLPYQLHVPVGDASQPRPLIVHLHGSGQHAELAVNERLPLLVSLAGPEPIIVYPRSPGGWRGPAVGELIDALTKLHAIDPARIYLIGFSLGGMGSWEVALDQPERFAAVVPIGGRMGSPADAHRLKDVPVWVFNGEHDPSTTCEEASMMVEALRRAGGKPQFTVLPGRSHGDSQDAAYRHPGLFDWMLAQRRGSTR